MPKAGKYKWLSSLRVIVYNASQAFTLSPIYIYIYMKAALMRRKRRNMHVCRWYYAPSLIGVVEHSVRRASGCSVRRASGCFWLMPKAGKYKWLSSLRVIVYNASQAFTLSPIYIYIYI